MEQFEPRNLEVFSHSSNEVLNSCSGSLYEVYNTAHYLTENISPLNRFIELNEPFSERTGNTEQSSAEVTSNTKQRAESFDYCKESLANNINNSKQTLKCILKVLGCGVAKGKSFRKLAESFGNIVKLFRRHRREDLRECFLDGLDNAHQTLGSIPKSLNQIFTTGRTHDLLNEIIH